MAPNLSDRVEVKTNDLVEFSYRRAILSYELKKFWSSLESDLHSILSNRDSKSRIKSFLMSISAPFVNINTYFKEKYTSGIYGSSFNMNKIDVRNMMIMF